MIIFNFEEKLNDLITEELLGKIAPAEVDEYFDWINCQISQMLIEAQEFSDFLSKTE